MTHFIESNKSFSEMYSFSFNVLDIRPSISVISLSVKVSSN